MGFLPILMQVDSASLVLTKEEVCAKTRFLSSDHLYSFVTVKAETCEVAISLQHKCKCTSPYQGPTPVLPSSMQTQV